MELRERPVNGVLYVGFNQDSSCFVVGTATGFRIFNTDPFRLVRTRTIPHCGGLGLVCMLWRCNAMALCGAGNDTAAAPAQKSGKRRERPRFCPRRVMVWDDKKETFLADMEFPDTVKCIHMTKHAMVVAVEKRIYVHRLKDLELTDHIETLQVHAGLVSVSTQSVGPDDQMAVTCPGMQSGKLLVAFYRGMGERTRSTVINAHESTVTILSLSPDGSLVATASEKGTIIRVFDTDKGMDLYRFRRGADRAEIYCIAWSATMEYIAATSDKSTIHVFHVAGNEAGSPSFAQGQEPDEQPPTQPSERPVSVASAHEPSEMNVNRKSKAGFMATLMPKYFASQWSFAKFRVPDYRCICAFSPEDPSCIIALCAHGQYFKASFSKESKNMTQEARFYFDEEHTENPCPWLPQEYHSTFAPAPRSAGEQPVSESSRDVPAQ